MLLAAHGFSVAKVSHYSAEYSVFVVLQTLLNAVLRRHRVLAESLRRAGRASARGAPGYCGGGRNFPTSLSRKWTGLDLRRTAARGTGPHPACLMAPPHASGSSANA
jgi:hypothetical protein